MGGNDTKFQNYQLVVSSQDDRDFLANNRPKLVFEEMSSNVSQIVGNIICKNRYFTCFRNIFPVSFSVLFNV